MERYSTRILSELYFGVYGAECTLYSDDYIVC